MAPNNEWQVSASEYAVSISNPIRSVIEGIKMPENPGKKLIPLSIGDPTVYGNLKAPAVVQNAITANVQTFKYNGYQHSTGNPAAREAIAKYHSSGHSSISKEDVFITTGCAGALDMIIRGMINAGDNILLPQPGFPLYESISKSAHIEARYYKLLPESNWECDLDHMTSLIDSKTKAILITNPSNPCGSVFTKEHLYELLALAEKHKVPIIADEIYGDMTFGDSVFYPIASLSERVPVITVSGLAKHYLVPGWRVGWIVFHDPVNVFADLKQGLGNIAMITFGANSLAQSIIPSLLTPEPGSKAEAQLRHFKKEYFGSLEENAKFTMEVVKDIPGLEVVPPQGAMYALVKLDVTKFKDIENDMEFTQKLLNEESVLVLPGKCFELPNYFRSITCPPKQILNEAYGRMRSFCKRHSIE